MELSRDLATVLVDTNVISRSLLPFASKRNSPEAELWRNLLAGKAVAIAVQTRVELLAWPRLQNWGDERRLELESWVDAIRTFQVTNAVQRSYVDLTVRAKKEGHAIYDHHHTADRWIAATALTYDLPLASEDGIFRNIPGLDLLGPP